MRVMLFGRRKSILDMVIQLTESVGGITDVQGKSMDGKCKHSHL